METMFFSFVLGDGLAPPEPSMSARLDFHGEPSGSFGVAVAIDSSRQIAAGFLAQEADEISQNQIEDVVCELANMICGSVLSRLESDRAFELGHPELAPFPLAPERWYSFELDNGILGVWLTLNWQS